MLAASSAAVLLAALLLRASTARAEDACPFDPKGMLFITDVTVLGLKDSEALNQHISARLQSGAESWSGGKVVTVLAIKQISKTRLDEMNLLNSTLHVPVESQLQGLFKTGNQALTSVADVTLTKAGRLYLLNVRLLSLCTNRKKQGYSQIVSSKAAVVEASDASDPTADSTVLQQLGSAAYQMGVSLNKSATPPDVDVKGGDGQVARVGKPLTLEASAPDAEFDEVSFHWEGNQSGLLVADGSSKATFTPSRAGVSRVKVKACQTANPEICGEKLVAIDAHEMPSVSVAPDQVVSLLMDTPETAVNANGAREGRASCGPASTPIRLTGRCTGCSESGWTQTAGPNPGCPRVLPIVAGGCE